MQLDVKDAAAMFGVTEKTVYRWIKQRQLPAHHFNEQYRFNRAELLEWATSNEVDVSAEVLHESEFGDQSIPRLDEALREGGIHYGVGGTDKASVLREIVGIMRLPEDVDRDFIYQVLLTRESSGSTGIGDGIAIPHVRSPIVFHVRQPSIILCFLENPIDFDALDGRPVNIAFTLVSSTVRGHLHLLSKLAFALKDSRFRDVVVGKRSRDEILDAACRVEEGLSNSKT